MTTRDMDDAAEWVDTPVGNVDASELPAIGREFNRQRMPFKARKFSYRTYEQDIPPKGQRWGEMYPVNAPMARIYVREEDEKRARMLIADVREHLTAVREGRASEEKML